MRPTDLAAKTGLDNGIISRALSDARVPSTQSLVKIAEALRVPVETVYEAADIPMSSKSTDDLDEEALYLVKQLDRDKKQQAVRVLRALSDEGEKRKGLSTKHVTE